MHQLAPKSEVLYKYVLILKDDLSGFVEWIPSTSPDHFTAADTLMEWYKVFGVLRTLVSDQGSYFVDKTLKELNWIVEIFCHQLRSPMRFLLYDLKMQAQYWPSLFPVLQSIWNNSKSSQRGGYAPITIMTGPHVATCVQAVSHSSSYSTKTTEATVGELTTHCKNLQNALETMHKTVWESISTKREAKWKRMTVKAPCPKLSVGFFVLLAIDP